MILLKEGETFPSEVWINKLDLQSLEFNQLLQRAVFKPIKNSKKELVYRLAFVGEIALSRNYAISVPKCLGRSPDKSLLFYIQQTLKKYFDSLDKQDSVQREDIENLFFYNDTKSKEVEVYLTLKTYFLNKGIYKHRIQKLTNDTSRPIDWKKTIQQSHVYVSEDSAFYSNPYTKKYVEEENLVSEIFKAILAELTNKYEHSEVKDEILQNCHSYLTFENIKDNAISYCERIRLESSNTFNSDDLLVLSILIEYLEDKLGHLGDGVVRLYGTSSFHVIWEHICSTVFENKYEELASMLHQPAWVIEGEFHEKGSFIPDVITKKEDKTYIIDAKYYYPIPKKVCGVSDIAKQLIYAQISGNKDISNILVFPSSNEHNVVNKGYVSIFDDDKVEVKEFKKQRIQVLELSFITAIKTYLGLQDLDSVREEIWASID